MTKTPRPSIPIRSITIVVAAERQIFVPMFSIQYVYTIYIVKENDIRLEALVFSENHPDPQIVFTRSDDLLKPKTVQ